MPDCCRGSLEAVRRTPLRHQRLVQARFASGRPDPSLQNTDGDRTAICLVRTLRRNIQNSEVIAVIYEAIRFVSNALSCSRSPEAAHRPAKLERSKCRC